MPYEYPCHDPKGGFVGGFVGARKRDCQAHISREGFWTQQGRLHAWEMSGRLDCHPFISLGGVGSGSMGNRWAANNLLLSKRHIFRDLTQCEHGPYGDISTPEQRICRIHVSHRPWPISDSRQPFELDSWCTRGMSDSVMWALVPSDSPWGNANGRVGGCLIRGRSESCIRWADCCGSLSTQ